MVIDNSDWLESPRSRVFIIGIADEAGGVAAADWAMWVLGQVVQARQAEPSTPVWSIICLQDSDEDDRIAASQAPQPLDIDGHV
eukprot:2751058-Lingulodinium_polyedra.AAC.1